MACRAFLTVLPVCHTLIGFEVAAMPLLSVQVTAKWPANGGVLYWTSLGREIAMLAAVLAVLPSAVVVAAIIVVETPSICMLGETR